MHKLNVGVVGVGHLGKIHARIYSSLPNVKLAGLCDTDKTKGAISKEHRTDFYQDYQDLIEKVDAVSIAVPTSSHFKVSKAFLEAGKHVLIEKPITKTLEEADTLLKMAEDKNLVLQVGHVERFNAGFKQVEKMAKNLRFIEIHRLGPFSGRINDCGVVLDLMIHDLDIVLQLVKSEIVQVDSVGVNVLTPFEDIANVRIKFANGCIADLTASRLTPEKQRKIRIFQENAYISLDYAEQKAKIYEKKDNDISASEIDIKKEEPLKSELENFASAVISGSGRGKPDVEARHALELALQITQDIKSSSCRT